MDNPAPLSAEQTAKDIADERRAMEAQAVHVVIDWLGGNCPVQAEGTINARRFYFRSRGEHWSLEVHPTAIGDYLKWPQDDAQWGHEEEWGEGPFDAGWMPQEVAREMIAKAAAKYAADLQKPEQK